MARRRTQLFGLVKLALFALPQYSVGLIFEGLTSSKRMPIKLFTHHDNRLEFEFARLADDIVRWLYCADDFVLINHCQPSLIIG